MKERKTRYKKMKAAGVLLCLTAVLFLSVFAAASCGTKSPRYEFINATYNDANNNLIYSQMTKTDNGTYHFPRIYQPGSLEKDDANKFVYFFEQIHKQLNLTQKVTVCVNLTTQPAVVSAKKNLRYHHIERPVRRNHKCVFAACLWRDC